jgi:hypothetical protein
MTKGPAEATAPSGCLVLAIYAALASSGAFVLAMAAPWPLGALGIIDPNWAILTGMWLALPTVLSLLAAATLSLVGLIRGPGTLRKRIGAWWVVGGGGCALSAVIAPSVDFNPYLRTPPAPFGVSHAALVIGLGLCILLPCMWILRAERTGLFVKSDRTQHPRP